MSSKSEADSHAICFVLLSAYGFLPPRSNATNNNIKIAAPKTQAQGCWYQTGSLSTPISISTFLSCALVRRHITQVKNNIGGINQAR